MLKTKIVLLKYGNRLTLPALGIMSSSANSSLWVDDKARVEISKDNKDDVTVSAVTKDHFGYAIFIFKGFYLASP